MDDVIGGNSVVLKLRIVVVRNDRISIERISSQNVSVIDKYGVFDIEYETEVLEKVGTFNPIDIHY